MEQFTSLEEIKYPLKSSTLTIGTFDAIHLGHSCLLKELNRESLNNSNKSVLITFNPNPYIVINKKNENEYHIITKEEKYKLVEQFRIDILLDLPFNKSFSKISALEFLKNYIIAPFNPKKIIIGYNHNFGHNREGNCDFLKVHQNTYNYSVDIIDPYKNDNKIVSSSLIRELINSGQISKIKRFLGRNYKINGKVIHGNSIGREISFPTANISLNSINQLLPSNGVYLVKITINNISYNGMCNIGVKPTFSDSQNKSIEVHIFNYDKFDLYSQFINIEFVDYVRNEIKFNNKQDLKEQLMKDKEYCMSLIF